MTIIDKLNKISQIDQLIRQKRTGTVSELAQKLNLSERQARRYIEEMRDMGAEIEYCKQALSYKYNNPVQFNYGFTKIDMNKIKGGSLVNGHKMTAYPFTLACRITNLILKKSYLQYEQAINKQQY